MDTDRTRCGKKACKLDELLHDAWLACTGICELECGLFQGTAKATSKVDEDPATLDFDTRQQSRRKLLIAILNKLPVCAVSSFTVLILI